MKRFARTDVGNARLIAHHHHNNLKFDHLRKQWMLWSGHRWHADPSTKVQEIVKATIRRRYLASYRDFTGEESQREAKWTATSESMSRIHAALQLAQSEPLLSDYGKSWDANPWLLGVRNGVIDLRTGKLRMGRPSDRITFQCGTSFDPTAQCPKWLQFLSSTFVHADLIAFIQRAIGYSLTGATTEQCLFLCYGSGANGKSTFLNVMHALMGDYSYNLPFSAFEQNARSAISNDIAALPGRRFVIANETNESVRLNEARIKALTGGDIITCRKLYAENFEFRPVCKPWLAFNHKPIVRDDSHGFWRRVRLIPFTQLFEGTSANSNLFYELLEELPGVLRWSLEGVLAWKKADLGQTEGMKYEAGRYRKESDPTNDFLSDKYVVDPSAYVAAAELWGSYLAWVAENHELYPLNRQEFARRLEDRGFTQARVGHNRTRAWRGLRSSSPSDPLDLRTEDTIGGLLQ